MSLICQREKLISSHLKYKKEFQKLRKLMVN
jgi:hypothetical protein